MPRPEERWTLEPRTSPVEKFSANVLRALLKDSLGRQRIEMFRQPFFYLPGNERRGYEVFGRLKARPGVYVAANDYAGIARQNNMTVRLDKLLAKDVVQALHSGKYPEDIFFLNIDAGHLKDADYMGILLELARQSREKARQICLDIDHRAYETLSQTTRQILSGLARVGFGLCLDQAKPFKIDPDELLKARFRTVKISAPALRLCHADERKFKLFMRIKRRLDANGIRVIATCAEQEADLSIIRQFGINWAQGYALAHPAHVNFNVAAATGKAA